MKYNILSILPVYNEEEYLKQWFINAKRYCNHIIAYDDGSTDKSLEILQANLPKENIIHNDINEHNMESYHHRDMWTNFRENSIKPDWIACNGADELLPDYPEFIQDLEAIIDHAEEDKCEVILWYHAELWFHPHWYRTDAYFSQVPFARLLKYHPDAQFSEKQLVDHAHCVTFPDYYTQKDIRKMVVLPEKMMTLHYGYMDQKRIIDRFERMAKHYEMNKFGTNFIYLNWIRGVDLRDIELKHLPHKWVDCQGCSLPDIRKLGECLLPKDNPYIKYFHQFKMRRYIEKL